MDNSLEGLKAIFLDLDGTIYLGSELIDGALDFLNRCEKRGIKRYFLSNNSSRSVEQYVSKLEKLGIPANDEDVLLSTHDLLSWLKRNNISKTWLVGTEGMRDMLEKSGIQTDSSDPQYVVLGISFTADTESQANRKKSSQHN